MFRCHWIAPEKYDENNNVAGIKLALFSELAKFTIYYNYYYYYYY